MIENGSKMTKSGNIKAMIERAIKEFNRWHSPEATAGLLSFDGRKLEIEMSGPYCKTCGLYDYFDDLRLELERALNRPIEIQEHEANSEDGYRLVYLVGDGRGTRCVLCGAEDSLIRAKNEAGEFVHICESCYDQHCEGFEAIP
jgi:hypothetical protein